MCVVILPITLSLQWIHTSCGSMRLLTSMRKYSVLDATLLVMTGSTAPFHRKNSMNSPAPKGPSALYATPEAIVQLIVRHGGCGEHSKQGP